MTDRSTLIRQQLQSAFHPETLNIQDDGAKHVGHTGAKDGRGHFSVEIVAAAFNETTTLERHRMIYAALGDLMETDIHALQINARGTRA